MRIPLWQRCLSLLLPSTCLSCESDHPASAPTPELGLCCTCSQSIRWRTSPEFLAGDMEGLYAACEFEGGIRNAIHHFKYQRCDALGGDFAHAWLMRTPFEAEDYDLVVSVPMTPLKTLRRGYNPAAVVAGVIAERQRKPHLNGVLRRRFLSSSQTHKNKSERLLNARAGFVVGEPASLLRNAAVLLVDDVCTTGATMNACARLLKRLGARRVLGAALARDMLA